MTHAMTPTLEELERGLTDAQAYVVMDRGMAFGRCHYDSSLLRPLERRGLFSRERNWGFRDQFRLTPLGLTLRAYLEKTHG